MKSPDVGMYRIHWADKHNQIRFSRSLRQPNHARTGDPGSPDADPLTQRRDFDSSISRYPLPEALHPGGGATMAPKPSLGFWILSRATHSRRQKLVLSRKSRSCRPSVGFRRRPSSPYSVSDLRFGGSVSRSSKGA